MRQAGQQAKHVRIGLALVVCGWLLALPLALSGCGSPSDSGNDGPPDNNGAPDDTNGGDVVTTATLDGYLFVPRPGSYVADGYLFVPRPGARDVSGRQDGDELAPIITDSPTPPEGYMVSAGTRVVIPALDVETITTDTGYFLFVSLTTTEIVVEAFPEGFDSIEATVECTSDFVIIRSSPDPPEGFVPAAGVAVTIPELGITVTTDAEGRYYIRNVPPGDYVLRLSGGPLGDTVWEYPVQVNEDGEPVHGLPALIDATVD